MTEKFLSEWLEKAKEVSIRAGEKILEVYGSSSFGEEVKKDRSPLTRADRLSHEEIMAVLERSGLPVLSEEGRDIPYDERKGWDHFWMVDPLDGTKEFIKGNGEFTVNISLVHKDRSVLGVVYVPVSGDMYWARKGKGAFHGKNGSAPVRLSCVSFTKKDKGLRIVGSRSHMNSGTQAFIEGYDDPEIVSMGSSLKFMLIAEGKAHIYPRIAPTMEWDTAAAQIIVEEAGGTVEQYENGQPVVYNKADLLNPFFVVEAKLK